MWCQKRTHDEGGSCSGSDRRSCGSIRACGTTREDPTVVGVIEDHVVVKELVAREEDAQQGRILQ